MQHADELLQEAGVIEDGSGLYDSKNLAVVHHLNAALRANGIYQRDVDYIVRDGEVIIVDEFTGRTLSGRRWSDGLHQAVEAKEGVPIQRENQTLATVTFQNLFRMYKKLAGMTGTADTEAFEFQSIYGLEVVVIPTHMPMVRTDNSDMIFLSQDPKYRSVIEDIKACHERGQPVTEIKRMHKTGRPVLVGTTSVEKSEILSEMLVREGVTHQVLNAKPENVERESEIVAQSGRKNAVTLSTNMAGRGTDILLGGNPDYTARLKLREMLMPEIVSVVDAEAVAVLPGATAAVLAVAAAAKKRDSAKIIIRNWNANPALFPCELSSGTLTAAKKAIALAVSTWGLRKLSALEAEDRLSIACEKGATDDAVVLALREVFQSMLREFKVVTDVEKAEVVQSGGLHVIGTERHESRRIDNQLRGRSGRQGDPGSTRFFLSLEDALFRVFGGDKIKNLMVAFQIEDLPMESTMLSEALNTAQKKVENYFFDIRKQLFDYDQVVNTQRDKIYSERRKALLSKDLTAMMVEYAERTADDILEANVADRSLDPSEWKLDALAGKMRQYCYLLESLTGDQLLTAARSGGFEGLRAYMRTLALDAYKEKVRLVEAYEPGLMPEAQRFFLLSQTDALWKQHLGAIKFLQQAVGLRGYASKDPLTEFKLEGYNLFVEMTSQVRRNVIYNVYMFEPKRMVKSDATENVNSAEPPVAELAAAAVSGGSAKQAVAVTAGSSSKSSKKKK
ncbi:MAG: hypothetical protein WDW38_004438 [Sanguina aurantia]